MNESKKVGVVKICKNVNVLVLNFFPFIFFFTTLATQITTIHMYKVVFYIPHFKTQECKIVYTHTTIHWKKDDFDLGEVGEVSDVDLGVVLGDKVAKGDMTGCEFDIKDGSNPSSSSKRGSDVTLDTGGGPDDFFFRERPKVITVTAR